MSKSVCAVLAASIFTTIFINLGCIIGFKAQVNRLDSRAYAMTRVVSILGKISWGFEKTVIWQDLSNPTDALAQW